MGMKKYLNNHAQKDLLQGLSLPLNPLATLLNITEACLKENGIYIGGHTPSKKNSRRWVGKMLISSKACLNYKKNASSQFFLHKNTFLEKTQGCTKPIILGIYLIRKDRRIFDYNNISQIILDMMVAHKWIADDNADEIIPVFLGYTVNKEKAGAILLLMQ